MQQKFKIGDKVKVLTKAYPFAYGAEGVVTKIGPGDVCMVERNAADYPSDQYGTFDTDAWRYCFYEEELELVEDKPKTKFKAGDKVVCVDVGDNLYITKGSEYVVWLNLDDKVVITNDTGYTGTYLTFRFELVTDQEVSNTEPDYVIGQEVYVSNDFNRYLRKGILLDASPRNGLMHVNIGGFDCFVEEERVYTKEMKGN